MPNLVEVQASSRQETQEIEKTQEVRPKAPVDLTLSQPELEPKKAPDRGPRFSLSAEDVDVKSILYALSKETGQNITIDPEISQKVTVHLKDVTLKEVLDNVLEPLNLRYEITEDFIQVLTAKMQARVFHLNYLVSRRQGLGSMRVSQNGSSRSGQASDSALPTPAMRTGSHAILSSEETDLWREIASGLQQIISGGESPSTDAALMEGEPDPSHSAGNAYFSINKQAGVIIVNAYPEVLLHVADFLEEIEGSAQRQVLIQAKIIEVSLKEDFKSGIDWSQIPLEEDTGGTLSKLPGYVYGVDDQRLEKVLEALAEQGEIVAVANPKIAALNNQRALLKVGREDTVFIPEASQATAIAQTATHYIASPVTLGIVLDVVPQINVNGNVMMSLHTRISRKAGERASPNGAVQIPILDVQESSNVVLARNGQTVVIGGLTKTGHGPKAGPTYPLERIPVMGGLFHEDRTQIEKSELVILLTPEIMVGQAIDDRWRIEEKRLKRFKLPLQTYKMPTFSEGK